MRESRNILGWLGLKQEEMILADARLHVDVTYQTVEWFKKAMLAFISGDDVAKKAAIEKVRECERKADELRVKMVDSLSTGLLVPPDREDIMHFVKALDRIADWTNGSARLLDFITQKISPAIAEELANAAEVIFSSISKLKDGIHAVMDNQLDRAIADCNEVERLESEADDQKRTLIALIIKTKMDAPMLLLLYQLAEYME
ncbi:MAG: DUF47 family protein, partial [Candidatus Omnitrophota bacterium]